MFLLTAGVSPPRDLLDFPSSFNKNTEYLLQKLLIFAREIEMKLSAFVTEKTDLKPHPHLYLLALKVKPTCERRRGLKG